MIKLWFCWGFFRKGSVVASVVVSLDSQFKDSPSILVQELNKANTIAGYRFDKSYTSEEGILLNNYSRRRRVDYRAKDEVNIGL